MNTKRIIYLLIGPILLIVSSLGLTGVFGTAGAQAIGVSLWMIFWWITRPVHITITALLPALVNAFLNMVPMTDVISQYSCESIVLVFASGLIIMPWASIGLDRRIALKVLSVVGPSMKSQTIVWLCATTIFSTVLPNIAVVTLFCPIAVAMLKAAGEEDISTSKAGLPIMLAIAWGVSLGGGGTPIGGAFSRVVVGMFADQVSDEIGLGAPKGTRVLFAKAKALGAGDVLCREKLCPVIAYMTYKTFKEGVAMMEANLDHEGKGHSIAVHSNTPENVEYAAIRCCVSRVVVNQPSGTTGGGSPTNGFTPTTTLGCGTWGNNSFAGNLNYEQFINITRVGYPFDESYLPDTDKAFED